MGNALRHLLRRLRILEQYYQNRRLIIRRRLFTAYDYKNGGVMERIDLRGRGIRPAVFDACPSEKLRQDTSLRSAQQPQQGEADPSVQESDRLP